MQYSAHPHRYQRCAQHSLTVLLTVCFIVALKGAGPASNVQEAGTKRLLKAALSLKKETGLKSGDSYHVISAPALTQHTGSRQQTQERDMKWYLADSAQLLASYLASNSLMNGSYMTFLPCDLFVLRATNTKIL